jgi:hypothetical protein
MVSSARLREKEQWMPESEADRETDENKEA